jgi:hypothetical protein
MNDMPNNLLQRLAAEFGRYALAHEHGFKILLG